MLLSQVSRLPGDLDCVMLPGRPSVQVSAKGHQDSTHSAYIPLQATEETISGLLCVANGTFDRQVCQQQVQEIQLIGKANS